jgi:hypothetical protein
LRKPSTNRKQSRPEQIQEAERIYEWLVLQQETGGDLIGAMVRGIEDPDERADVRVDLQQIADTLATAIKSGSKNAVWQHYQHHFVGDRNRNRFFAELRTLTRRIASARLSPLANRNTSRVVILMKFSVGTLRCCPKLPHHTSYELLFCTRAYLRIFCLGSLFKHQIFGLRNPRIAEQS